MQHIHVWITRQYITSQIQHTQRKHVCQTQACVDLTVYCVLFVVVVSLACCRRPSLVAYLQEFRSKPPQCLCMATTPGFSLTAVARWIIATSTRLRTPWVDPPLAALRGVILLATNAPATTFQSRRCVHFGMYAVGRSSIFCFRICIASQLSAPAQRLLYRTFTQLCYRRFS